MTKQIFKYPLLQGYSQIWMPKNAEVLTVQEQRDFPYIWALIDNTAVLEARGFFVYPTGEVITAPIGKYLGTFQVYNGDLVYHVFEEKR